MEYTLNEIEKARAIGCVENIKDKLVAIEMELNKTKPFKDYISEKINSICWDSNCIKLMCLIDEKEEK